MIEPDIQKIQNNEFVNSEQLVSLKVLAEEYGYTQHHFGLMCRQGKLHATRIGKKWLTTKECVEKYLAEVENKYKNSPIHYSQKLAPSFSVSSAETAVAAAAEASIYFSPRFFTASAFFVLFLCSVYFGVQDFILRQEKIKSFAREKLSEFVLRSCDNFLSFGNGLEENFTASVGGVNYLLGEFSFELKKYFMDSSELAVGFYGQIFELEKKIVAPSLEDVLVNSEKMKLKLGGIPYSLLSFSENFPKFDSVFFTHKNFSNFAFLSNVKESDIVSSFTERTKNNFLEFVYETRRIAVRFYDFAGNSALAFRDWIYDCGQKFKLAFRDNKDWSYWFKDKPILPPVEQPEEKEAGEAKEGIVVVPEFLVPNDRDVFKRDIKDIFSDEVFVNPDEEGDAGIIQPIFKKGKGDEYMYVMVPIDKKTEEKQENE